jgi:tryptophan synthase alpha chain
MKDLNPVASDLKRKADAGIALMTHVVIGYPQLDSSRELVRMMAEEGVDIIELQIPFSDPMGDGPTIRTANAAALKCGARVEDAFTLVRQLRDEDGITIPLLLMTYLNIVYTRGFDRFCAEAEFAGVDGFVIPDYNLAHEKVDRLEETATKYGRTLIRFVSLDTSAERMSALSKGASGFIYCFSTRGITGARDEMDRSINTHLVRIREFFPTIPLAAGFGISSTEHIRSLKGHADIAVVGSAILDTFIAGGLDAARAKVRELVYAAKG